MIYLIVLFLLLILTVRYDINGKTDYRDQWYVAVIVILILIAGLRFRLGEDTITYIYMYYHETPDISDIDVDFLLYSGQPPLWILFTSIIKTLGGKFFVIQLIEAAFVNILILKYFKKHSPYPFACAALYFFWRYQWYSMVVLKAAMALSIILYANDYFLEKKYKKGFLLILIATGFHQSSILLAIIPFLTFLRFNMLGMSIMVVMYFVSAILQSRLGDVFDLFEFADGVSNKLDNYLDTDFMTQVHNANYFIIRFFPLLIYPIVSLLYVKYKCSESKILKLEPFLMIGLIFQVMQFNIHISYRYVYIYLFYFIIFMVHFFIEFSKNSLKLTKSVAYVRTLFFFLPFLVSTAFFHSMLHENFNPYSSVFERSIDKDREKYYTEIKVDYTLNKNEY